MIEDDEESNLINMNSKINNSHTSTQHLDKELGGVPISTFNSTGDFIFHSEFIKHHAFPGWFNMPKIMDGLVACNYNKQYSFVSWVKM
jgi:hypothetical protein